ncbi:MAG: hypothetical protein F6K16_36395, partial [Symploca sp. SIO2B6]|nr:hypothetical protein [Symploca sp. SIO2B6]
PDDAKAVIEGLTNQSQFSLEKNLVDALVDDLGQELGEVRPIELQVVGNQLQTEDITTLEGYEEKGPKEALVGRFLEEIVTDCGPDNEQIAKLVLYLLTDENNTRPLKTRADLELELDIEPGKLDLILKLLVKSRLVFLIPASPDERYQLVHDYLVPFVREQQSARLIAEIEKEREQRKLTEAKLNNVLKQQLRTARRATLTLGSLAIAISGFAVITSLVFLNSLISAKHDTAKKELSKLIPALEAGKWVKNFPGVIPEVRLQTLSAINQTNSEVRLLNTFEAHEDDITAISLSQDSSLIASVGKDKKINVWEISGLKIADFFHILEPTAITINSDDFEIIVGDKSGQLLIFNLKTKTSTLLPKTHAKKINDIQISPNGKMYAVASDDQTISIWTTAGTFLGILEGHNTEISATKFNSDSNRLASYTLQDTVKVWNLDTLELIQEIVSYNTINADFSQEGQFLELINTSAQLKLYSLYTGKLLSTRTVPSYYSPPHLSYAFKLGKHSYGTLTSWGDRIYLGHYSNTIETPGHISNLKFNLTSQLLLTSSKNKIHIWSNKRYKENESTAERNVSNSPIYFSSDMQEAFMSITENKSTRINVITGDFFDSSVEISSDQLVGIYSQEKPEQNIVAVKELGYNVEIWNSNKDWIEIYPPENSYFTTAILSSNGEIVITGDGNGQIQAWDKDGQFIRDLGRHNFSIKKLRFDANDTLIIADDGKGLKIWDIEGDFLINLSNIARIEKWEEINFSNNGKFLVSRSQQGIVKLWSRNGELITILSNSLKIVNLIGFTPDSLKVLTYEEKRQYSDEPGAIKIWNTNGSLERTVDNISQNINFNPGFPEILAIDTSSLSIRSIHLNDSEKDKLIEHPGLVNGIKIVAGRNEFLTRGADRKIRLWTNDGKLVKVFKEHESSITSFALNSDSRQLISVDKSGQIKFWNLDDTHSFKTIESDMNNHPNEGYDYQIHLKSSNENFVLYGPDSIGIFDLNGEKLHELRKLNQASISLSNNFKNALSVSSKTSINLLGMDSDIIAQLKGHTDQVNSFSAIKDGSLLATASDDETVKIWDKEGMLLTTLEFEDSVSSINFSPDGKFLATASDDQLIRIFEISKNQLPKKIEDSVAKIESHTDLILSVLFSPNGKILASASRDETIRLWDIDRWEEIGEFEIPNFWTYLRNYNKYNKGDALYFSEDSSMLGFGNEKVYLRFIDRLSFKGMWIKEASFQPLNQIPSPNEISDKKNWLTMKGKRGKIVLSLGLDHELQSGCEWANAYLKTPLSWATEIEELKLKPERDLCDGILESAKVQ